MVGVGGRPPNRSHFSGVCAHGRGRGRSPNRSHFSGVCARTCARVCAQYAYPKYTHILLLLLSFSVAIINSPKKQRRRRVADLPLIAFFVGRCQRFNSSYALQRVSPPKFQKKPVYSDTITQLSVIDMFDCIAVSLTDLECIFCIFISKSRRDLIKIIGWKIGKRRLLKFLRFS